MRTPSPKDEAAGRRGDSAPPAAVRRRGERGIALIITLLIVALLSILVVEFTESVQVDTHLSRNALHALQATYLARSGINILAGALSQDLTPNVDPDIDDVWREFTLESCNPLPSLDLPPHWQLCARIVDESGKININMTRPRNPDPARAPTECQAGNELCWLESLKRLMTSLGMDEEAAEEVNQGLQDYWVTPTELSEDGDLAPYFDSVEEVAAAFPPLRTPAAFTALRQFTSALVARNQVITTRVNVNTAPAEVLRAILGEDDGAVDDMIARRQEEPCTSVSECLGGAPVEGGASQFTTRSSLFRLEATASVNGIGKTVRALVWRRCSRGTQEGETPCTLQYWDWQKESGVSQMLRSLDSLEDERLDDDLARVP